MVEQLWPDYLFSQLISANVHDFQLVAFVLAASLGVDFKCRVGVGESKLPAFNVVIQMKKVTKISLDLKSDGSFILFSEIWCGVSIFL